MENKINRGWARLAEAVIESGNVMPKTVKKPLVRRNAQALAEKCKNIS